MKKNFEELQAGKWYQSRNDGAIIQVEKNTNVRSDYPFVGNNGETYNGDGSYCSDDESEYDLIRHLPNFSVEKEDKLGKVVGLLKEYNKLNTTTFCRLVIQDNNEVGVYSKEMLLVSYHSNIDDTINWLETQIAELSTPRLEYLEEVLYKGYKYNFVSYKTPFTYKKLVSIVNSDGEVVIANINDIERI